MVEWLLSNAFRWFSQVSITGANMVSEAALERTIQVLEKNPNSLDSLAAMIFFKYKTESFVFTSDPDRSRRAVG